jgi:hypothetical protein
LQVVQVVTEVTSELVGTRVVELVVSGPQGIQGVEGPAGPGVPVGGSAGEVLVKQSATDFDLGYGMRHLDYTPVSTLAYGHHANTSLVMVLNRVNYQPVLLPRAVTLSQLTAQVFTAGAAGSVVRLGIYLPDSNGRPGELLVDAGTIDGTVTGVQSISISETVGGLIYLAAASQVAVCTMRAISSSSIPEYSGTDPAALLNNRNIFNENSVTGALPANAGTLILNTAGPAMRVTIA